MKTKRNVLVLLAILLIASLVVAVFVACDNGDKPQPSTSHTHTFSEQWTHNDTYHWHAANCGDTDEVKDKGEHIIGSDGKCTVCDYEVTAPEPDPDPNPEPETPHTHTFSEQWSYDPDNHWHAATCCDTDEVKDKGEHIFGDNGKCSVCGCVSFSSEGVIYKLNPDEQSYCVFDGSNAVSPNIIILSEYDGKPVTLIGDRAFYDCNSLTFITIPSSVTSIGSYAFSGCSSLQNVIFEGDSQLQSIDDYAFSHCGLTFIKIPSNVTSIGDVAFSYCSSLTEIAIPSSVTRIGLGTFAGCSRLQSIVAEQGNPVYHSDGNCIIETISKTLIAGCKSSVIPIDGSVTSIGSCAFYGCSGLTSVTIPSSVTDIGYGTFYDCSSLQNVIFEVDSKLQSIGYGAFIYCYGLTSITIPSSVTSIGHGAFSYCSNNLQSLVVEQGNPVYHSKDNCIIETSSKTLIAGCKNSVIPTDGSVTSIGSYAFGGYSGLTSVTIPSSVTSIGHRAFDSCSSLQNVIFDGDSQLQSIGDCAFGYCNSLTSFTIPNLVTSIGDGAFSWCRSLQSLVVEQGNSVYHSDGNCIIETASKTLIAGCKTSVISTDGSVICIGDEAFNGSGLTEITIPSSVTSIGSWAFRDCSNLRSVIFDDDSQLQNIGEGAFCRCGLTSITIPSSVTSIGDWAFSGCYLQRVIFEGDSQLQSIGDEAFCRCDRLMSITIPSSVTSIGSGAFLYCSSLKSVTFENPTGWNADGISITFDDPTRNAKYLTSTYSRSKLIRE